jgi:cell wall-associated NlpC family hydrolase
LALSSDRGSSESSDPTPDSATGLIRRAPSSTQAALLPTRRSMRPAQPAPHTRRPSVGRADRPAPSRSARAKGVVNIVVMTFAMGLFATIAIPSYAFDPVAAQPAFAASELQELKVDGAQTLQVSDDAGQATVTRDNYSATSMDEILARRAAEQAAKDAAAAAQQAEALRAQLAQDYSSYSGPTASDYLSAPPYPSFSLDQVYSVATQYVGVPYVYGGGDPSGFDCSGLVMFVYAQFGISLPHSVTSQNAIGTTISAADARPGDLVVWNDNSHDGIYAGNGNVLHAPYSGASVREQPIWDSNYHFVRLGI